MHSSTLTSHYIRWFEEIGIEDVSLVGGKNASLGELYRNLAPSGINVPNGFAITAEAYWDFLRGANLLPRIKEILSASMPATAPISDREAARSATRSPN